MPTLSDIAICLRAWEYSETSQTVRLLMREHGGIRGLAKGSRRDRGNFSGGFQPLTRGHLVTIVKPGRDLAILTEWRLLEIFPGIHHRLLGNRLGTLAVDLTGRLLTDGDPHPEIFDALLAFVRDLEQPGLEWGGLLRFQWTLLSETGFLPRLGVDVATDDALPEARLGPGPGAGLGPGSGAELGPGLGPGSGIEPGLGPGPGRDAATPTGDPDRLWFVPEAGGFTRHQPSTEAWRVRSETLRRLIALDAAMQAEEPPPPVADHAAAPGLIRANRLLSAYVQHLVGGELATLGWAYPDPRASG
ncbi:MAG: DNA repair protein RecO [Phycisphaerales bacterium]